MVGTLRKNNPELTQLITNNDKTVVNDLPKKHQNLMSTLHDDNKVSERIDQKPQIILDYYETKSTVDPLDQLVGTYNLQEEI